MGPCETRRLGTRRERSVSPKGLSEGENSSLRTASYLCRVITIQLAETEAAAQTPRTAHIGFYLTGLTISIM